MKKSVLLVEDSPIAQMVGKKLLESKGCQVTVVGSGEAAVAACQTNAYDLVWMDIGLPGIDGIEATEQIRQLQTSVSMPIIALTANEDAELKARAQQAGMTDYRLKPLSESLIEEIFQKYFQVDSLRSRLSTGG